MRCKETDPRLGTVGGLYPGDAGFVSQEPTRPTTVGLRKSEEFTVCGLGISLFGGYATGFWLGAAVGL
jgi:hypothetical protein